MRRSDISFTIALCVSLVAHGLWLRVLVEQYAADMRTLWIGAFPSIFSRHEEKPDEKKEQQKPPATQPAKEVVPPKPKPKPLDPPHPYYVMVQPAPQKWEKIPVLNESIPAPSEMGERTGKGFASNSSPGVEPMKALEGDEDQASLSREFLNRQQAGSRPEAPKRNQESADAEISLIPFGLSPSIPQIPSPLPHAVVRHIPQPETVVHTPTKPPTPQLQIPESHLIARGENHPIAPPAPPPPVDKTTASAEPIKEQPAPTDPLITGTEELKKILKAGMESQAGSNDLAAYAAILSDSDSDPFSKIGGAEFKNGKLEVRCGRKVKTVRPRLTLGGQWDVAAFANASVLLGVRFDAEGNVTNVDILHSSGSNALDLPTQRAMYQWWFETFADKSGHPRGDVMIWKITFR